jgi:hypothetical protein
MQRSDAVGKEIRETRGGMAHGVAPDGRLDFFAHEIHEKHERSGFRVFREFRGREKCAAGREQSRSNAERKSFEFAGFSCFSWTHFQI